MCVYAEARPTGMLALLDEQCSFRHSRPQDLTLKFKRALNSNPHFVPPRVSGLGVALLLLLLLLAVAAVNDAASAVTAGACY